jgi:O-antigen/teichoic acid export membrane protein
VAGLALIGVAAVFTIFSTGYASVLSGWGNFTSTNASSVVSAVLKLAAGIAIIMVSATANALAFAVIVAAVGGWLVLRMSTRRTIGSGATVDWRAVYFAGLDLRKTVLPIFFYSLTGGLVKSLGILLVKNLTTATIAGYYGVLTLFGSVFVMVSTAISQVASRAVCAAEYREPGSGRRPLGMAYLFIIAVSVVGIAAYAAFPQLIIDTVVGVKYAAVAPDLWLFGVSACIGSLLSLEVTLAYARNDLWISIVLALTVILTGLTTYAFHATIREIALDSVASLSVGFAGALLFNQLRRKLCMQPPMPTEAITPVL